MTRSINFAGQLRLVALDVDDDLNALELPGDFGDAIGAAGGPGIGQLRQVTIEGADFVVDFLVIGGDANAGRPGRPRGRLIGVFRAAFCPSLAATAFAAAWWRRAGRE